MFRRQQQISVALLAVMMLLGTGMPAVAASSNSAEKCARLKARIADTRLKLRLGYTAKQGRVLRTRLEGLESQQRLTCR